MTDRKLMQVSPQDFVKAVKDKEDLRGMPMIMSVWPTADNAQPKREWQGLTMEEVQEILTDPRYQMKPLIVHAIEAKLKEKNYG